MQEDYATLTDQLTQKGIRPSYQRIKILEYLHQSMTHPTVEDIFTALSPSIPSLSKATIYNTLHTFLQAGLVREVNIDLDAQRYDIELENHGHFRCSGCGTIYNFSLDLDQLVVEGLQAFQIEQKDVYFSGLCPGCLSKPTSS